MVTAGRLELASSGGPPPLLPEDGSNVSVPLGPALALPALEGLLSEPEESPAFVGLLPGSVGSLESPVFEGSTRDVEGRKESAVADTAEDSAAAGPRKELVVAGPRKDCPGADCPGAAAGTVALGG